MTIRTIEEKDFDEVLGMMRLFYASDALLIHPEEKVLRRTLTDSLSGSPYLTGFVFEKGETLAGYGLVAHSYSTERGGPCVWLEDIYVKPEYRGQGIGSGYLDFIARRYGDKAARLRLEAEPDNARAMEVYRKAGYEVLGYTQLVREMEKQ